MYIVLLYFKELKRSLIFQTMNSVIWNKFEMSKKQRYIKILERIYSFLQLKKSLLNYIYLSIQRLNIKLFNLLFKTIQYYLLSSLN